MMPKNVLQRLYNGRADVYEYKMVKDEKTKLTKSQEVKVFEQIPCRVSHKRIYPVQSNQNVPTAQMEIKLFLSNIYTIEPGSKIVVTQNTRERVYQSSGIPAVYSSHQEIILKELKGFGEV